jgi:hypothetical protein
VSLLRGIFDRKQRKPTTIVLCYGTIIGLFLIGLSTLLAYFFSSEILGINSFLVTGLLLVIIIAFLATGNRIGQLFSLLTLTIMVCLYNLGTGDLFGTSITKDIVLTWISLGFFTGIWALKFSYAQVNVMRFLLVLALVVLCVSYCGFRLIFPEAAKVDFTGSNFIGLCAVLLAMVSLKYFDNKTFNTSVSGTLFLTISLSTAFASSSRMSIFLTVILFLVIMFSTLLRADQIKKTLGAIFLCTLLISSLSLFMNDFSISFDSQLAHVLDRFGGETSSNLFEMQRLSQIFSFLNLFVDHPQFFFFPIPMDDYMGDGKGFSDNSFLEFAGYTGFLLAISIYLILEKRLFEQFTRLDAIVISIMLLFFNVFLWVPYVALVHMYMIAFPLIKTESNIRTSN